VRVAAALAGLDLVRNRERRLDRNGVTGTRPRAEPEPAGARGGVHADHLAVGVDERAAGVTGLQ
jgi:hypothetical protein